MMDYLETLNDIKDSIATSEEFATSQKVILIDLISNEQETIKIQDDSFVYFYNDVIHKIIDFDFEAKLTSDVYKLAQDNALDCLNISQSIQNLKDNSSLYNWIQNAIKFTDHLALHYLQDILNEEPVKQGDAGKERSRYIQINKKKNSAEKAGRILDNLYECRNKLEHRTVSDSARPNYQKIIPPNYRRAKKQIQKRYPEALQNFYDAYVGHYNN